MTRRLFVVLASFGIGIVTAPAAAEPISNSADAIFWACLITFLVTAAPYATSRRAKP